MLLLFGACVPAAPDNDEFKKFNAVTTVMGKVQEDGVLKVGVPNDRLAFATASSACSSDSPCEGAEGFVVDLAREIADALKVEMEIFAMPSDDLIGLVDEGEVQVAFPLVPITEKLVRKHSFTDPFVIGHQRALAPVEDASDEGFTLGSLEPSDEASDAPLVCEFIFPDVGVPVEELDGTVEVQTVDDPDGCGALFLKGEIDAAVGHDLALAGVIPFLEGTCGQGGCPGVPPLPRFVGDQFSTEGYGALVLSGESAWRDFVTQVLEESQQEGRWSALYEEWLQPLLGGEVLSPPGMSVEEAAALYPADL